MKHYLLQVLISFDQFCNALCGGWADETLSSRSYRWWRDGHRLGFMKVVVDTLFFFDANHCQDSFQSERLSRHLPPEFRD